MLSYSCANVEYKKIQDEESKHRPYSCVGYHVSKAAWEFVDQYDQQVQVTGKCVQGMKHGNFTFYLDGTKVAVAKYVRDEEKYTTCYENGGQTYKVLSSCIESYVQAKKSQKQ